MPQLMPADNLAVLGRKTHTQATGPPWLYCYLKPFVPFAVTLQENVPWSRFSPSPTLPIGCLKPITVDQCVK